MIKAPGSKPSATMQPFTLTPLHIHDDRIGSLEAALAAHYAPERVGESERAEGGRGRERLIIQL